MSRNSIVRIGIIMTTLRKSVWFVGSMNERMSNIDSRDQTKSGMHMLVKTLVLMQKRVQFVKCDC